LKDFVKQYPKSEYINEARELLINVMSQTNNYKDALALINTIGINTESAKKNLPEKYYMAAP